MDACAKARPDQIVPTRVPRPTWTARRTWGHAEISSDAAAHIDRVLTFHGLDPKAIRADYIDTCRRRNLCRLSWVARRSDYPAAQTWRHERVRFALDDLVIRSGKTVLVESPFDDPIDIITYRLAIEPGGLLRIEAPLTLTVGELWGLAPWGPTRGAPPPMIEFGAPSGCAGVAGARGEPGADGTHDHPNGSAGSSGAGGDSGMAGIALPDQNVFIHTLRGATTLIAGAGTGGAGGQGGAGGTGGRGHSIPFFDMGHGGDGGPGGPGGDGGAGGDGGTFQIGIRHRCESSSLTMRLEKSASGGPGGSAGVSGSGGFGAPDGHPGHRGTEGRSGPAGNPITLIWTKGEAADA